MLLVDRQALTPQPPSTPSATSVSISLDNSRDGGMSPTFPVEITPPEEPFEDERGLPTASSIPDSHIETLSQRQTDEDQVTHFFEMVRFFLH